MLFEPLQNYTLALKGAEVSYFPAFFKKKEAFLLFHELKEDLEWHQKSVKLFGKFIPEPRLVAWYGDEHCQYRYSGVRNEPLPWRATLSQLRCLLEERLQAKFNCVLANYYRQGQDSMGLHSDDEPELGDKPLIASLSFGQNRFFRFVHKQKKEPSLKICLEHGSLLVMGGDTQKNWLHEVPKTKTLTKERINLTFRYIKPV